MVWSAHIQVGSTWFCVPYWSWFLFISDADMSYKANKTADDITQIIIFLVFWFSLCWVKSTSSLSTEMLLLGLSRGSVGQNLTRVTVTSKWNPYLLTDYSRTPLQLEQYCVTHVVDRMLLNNWKLNYFHNYVLDLLIFDKIQFDFHSECSVK
jgi:hypothetical protein